MLLRCTAKLLTLLRVRELTTAPPDPDDWYATLLWLDGRKCLLLTHAGTLFPVFAADVRAAELRPLGPWLTATIGDQFAPNGSRPTPSVCWTRIRSGSPRPPAVTCSAS
jgi:hypothetical protein